MKHTMLKVTTRLRCDSMPRHACFRLMHLLYLIEFEHCRPMFGETTAPCVESARAGVNDCQSCTWQTLSGLLTTLQPSPRINEPLHQECNFTRLDIDPTRSPSSMRFSKLAWHRGDSRKDPRKKSNDYD